MEKRSAVAGLKVAVLSEYLQWVKSVIPRVRRPLPFNSD